MSYNMKKSIFILCNPKVETIILKNDLGAWYKMIDRNASDFNTNIEDLLNRALMFLANGKWQNAEDLADQIIATNQKLAEAYLIKAMAKMHAYNRGDIKNVVEEYTHKQITIINCKKDIAIAIALEKLTEDLYMFDILDKLDNLPLELNVACSRDNYYDAIEALKKGKVIFRCRDASNLSYDDENISKAIQYGDEELVGELKEYISLVNNFLDNERKTIEEQEQKERDAINEADKIIETAKCLRRIGKYKCIEKEILEKRKQLEILYVLLSNFERVQVVIHEKMETKYELERSLLDLKAQRESLGWFSGKKRKYLDEKILATEKNCKSVEKAVEDLRKQLRGFDSIVMVKLAIDFVKKELSVLETKIDERPEWKAEYSFEQAMRIMKNDLHITEIAMDKMPSIGVIFAIYGDDNACFFGRYPQEDESTKSVIEWTILQRKGNKALLISKCVLDCAQYNNTYSRVTWENCTLKKWLNTIFLTKAFNLEEQSLIIDESGDSAIPNNTSVTNNTSVSKVSLLTDAEAKQFIDCGLKKYRTTHYSDMHGAIYHVDGVGFGGKRVSPCWLRSDKKDLFGAIIEHDGNIKEMRYPDGMACGIRPIIWVGLD